MKTITQVNTDEFSNKLKATLMAAIESLMPDDVIMLGLDYKFTETEVVRTDNFQGIPIKFPDKENICKLEIRFSKSIKKLEKDWVKK